MMATPSQVVSERKVQEDKLHQSSEDFKKLKIFLENWTDLAVAVVLIGKSEALFKRILAIHYKRTKTVEEIVQKLLKFDHLKKKKDEDKLTALRKAITKLEDNFDDIRDKVDCYDWFENHDTRNLFRKHKTFEKLASEDKERLSIGLIHEYTTLLFREKHWFAIDEVKRLKLPAKVEEPEEMRKIRNAIVHLRTNHCFDGFKERFEFLKDYERFVKLCIQENNWLYLPDREQRERIVEEYLKPQEDFWNIRQIIETYQEKIANLERLCTELEEDHAEKLGKLKAERDDYKRKYDSLFDHIESRKGLLEFWIRDTTTKIKDGRESASEGVVKNILEIEKIVEKLLDVTKVEAETNYEEQAGEKY